MSDFIDTNDQLISKTTTSLIVDSSDVLLLNIDYACQFEHNLNDNENKVIFFILNWVVMMVYFTLLQLQLLLHVNPYLNSIY